MWEIKASCIALAVNALTCLQPYLLASGFKLNGWCYQIQRHSSAMSENNPISCLQSVLSIFVQEKKL